MSRDSIMAPIAGPPANLQRALWQGLQAVWDHLGLMVAMGLTGSLLVCATLSMLPLLPRALPPTADRFAGLALLVVAVSLPAGGACAMAHRIGVQESVCYAGFWREGLRLWYPMLQLSLIHLIVLFVLLNGIVFYAHRGGLFGIAGGTCCLYALLFWFMMACHHAPLLAAQAAGEMHGGRRCLSPVMRRAFYLTLARPFYTLGLLTVLLLLAAVLAFTGMLALLLWPGALFVPATTASRALWIQYGLVRVPRNEPVVPDEAFRLRI